MFCIKCGTKLADDARFCSNCGARVVSLEEIAPEAERREDEVSTTSVPSFEAPEVEAIAKEDAPEPKPLSAFDLNWETTDDEAPSKSAFDKRVSFDWTSVIDESHRKPVGEIRSPWDPVPENETVSEIPVPDTSAPYESRIDDELAKEFEGIDVTPTTEKGRTLTFIEILKKEREEKERAEQARVEAMTETSEEGDFSEFDNAAESMTEIEALKASGQMNSHVTEEEPEPVAETEIETAEPAEAEEIAPNLFELPEIKPLEEAPKETIIGLSELIENEPAPAPQSFVQPAESEMEDIKAAYDEAKAELPRFEMPAFSFSDEDETESLDYLDVEDEEDDSSDAEAYSEPEEAVESVEDLYLSGSFAEEAKEDSQQPETEYAEPEEVQTSESEDAYITPELTEDNETHEEKEEAAEEPSEAAEPSYELSELERVLEEERQSSARLEAELAAIIAAGNGHISGAHDFEEAKPETPSQDLYEAAADPAAEIPVEPEAASPAEDTEAAVPEAVASSEYENYEDGIDALIAELSGEKEEVETESDEEEYDFDAEFDDAGADEEAEDYFAEMIDSVVEKSNEEPEEDALTLEDIFGEETAESEPEAEVPAGELEELPEVPAEEAELDPIESEIAALKRRLAELISEKEEEEAVPANPAVPTIEELFPEEDTLAEVAELSAEDIVSEDSDATEIEATEDEPAEEPVSVMNQTEPVYEPELPADEESSELETEADQDSETKPSEIEPAYEAVISDAPRNEALDDIAHEAENAMSIEELEAELFGDDMLGEDGEMEATRKIDKFYTLYKKNEEFQKLLDDEYNRLQIEDDLPEEITTSLSDETITQLDNLVIPAQEGLEEQTSAKADTVAEETPAAEPEAAPAPAPAPAEEEEPKLSKKEAKKAAKAEARAKKEKELELEDEEEGGLALTVIAVIIAIILVFLLAAILILNFAPDSALGMKLDSIIQSISYFGTDISGDDGYLL
ncbi:MAG: zinc-ribbon domain-containing protein [Anaerovoracaceae bacterium]